LSHKGTYLQLNANNDGDLLAKELDPILMKHANLIKSFSYITPQLKNMKSGGINKV